jgi:glucose-6-phosphate isomerase
MTRACAVWQVLHVALRSAKTDTFYDEGRNVVPDVHAVLDKIRIFSQAVRNGAWLLRRCVRNAASCACALLAHCDVVRLCADVLHATRACAGEYLGATGKPLTDVVAIGIGGRHARITRSAGAPHRTLLC